MRDNTDMIQVENRKSTAIKYIDMNCITEYSEINHKITIIF